MVGTELKHYRITKALGRGGMGEVYLADDTRLKRQVAIKILPAALSLRDERRERFEREAQAVAALSHPNVVTVYSVEEVGDTHFITMEYVEGRTLADLIPKGGLPLQRLVPIAIQLADALSAAHERGIVHRDLKPANVIVTAGDRVKVLDFGLAKLLETARDAGATTLPTRELTGEGTIVGTVAYMSPEQAEGKSVDSPSDIFSLGVVLYEMAAGERPFKGDTSLSILSAVLKETPRALTDLNPALPRDLSRIVRRCLAKDPERRYQSAKDLRNDLEELAQSLASGELTAVATTSAARRSPWALVTAAVAAVAVLGIAAAWKFRAATAPSVGPPAATHTRLTHTDLPERFPSISPDGKWVVYASAASGNQDIYLQSVTGQMAINLTKDETADDSMPAFSPDGETIAFRSERDGGGLFLMGRTGESVRRLTTRGYHPAWSPGGREIVFATDGPISPENRPKFSELWIVSASAGEPRLLFAGDAVQPRVSPHGKRIAYWGVASNVAAKEFVGSNREIRTVDMKGERPVQATTHEADDWSPVWSPDGRWLYFLSNRAGSMSLWRVAIDEATGLTAGEPQALPSPAAYVADFSLSADGTIAAHSSILYSRNIGRVAFDPQTERVTGAAQAVTAGNREYAHLDVTKDGRFVVAASSSHAQQDLYVLSMDAQAERQLTNDVARDRAPRWSPDNRHIIFSSDRNGRYTIWNIDADGSGLRQVTTEPGRYVPVPSRDGSRLATVDVNARQLLIYDAHDTSRAPEALPAFPDSGAAYPSATDWSPDGRTLAVHANESRGVWLYSFDSRTYRRVADGGSARWFADGRRLVYERRGQLFAADSVSGATREVLALPGEDLSSPFLASNDSQLFFLRAATAGDIWVMRFAQK